MLGVALGHAALATATSDDSRPRLLRVFPGTPAARAGLQEADVITRIAERPVADVDAVQRAISTMPPGTVTSVDYVRQGRPATTRVTLAKMEVAGKKIITVRPLPGAGCESTTPPRSRVASLLRLLRRVLTIRKAACLLAKWNKEARPGTPACEQGCSSVTWEASG